MSAQPRDSGENQLAKAAAKETAAAKEEAKATGEAKAEDLENLKKETAMRLVLAAVKAAVKARPSRWTLLRTTITLQASRYTLRTNISF